MKFRLIPPGEFMMGSTAEEVEALLKYVDPNEKRMVDCVRSEGPRHKVVLTRPFYFGTTEVTQAAYEKVIGKNPSSFMKTGSSHQLVEGLDTSSHPVEQVAWSDAAEFCARLSQQEKLKPYYFRSGETITPLDGTGYRLPTEAEWEYACRAGTTTRFWSGDRDEESLPVGWSQSNSGGRTHAAGELKPNPFGLYDVHGNVFEWVQDAWDLTFYVQFQEQQAVDPSNPSTTSPKRLARGGDALAGVPSFCRSSYRNASTSFGQFWYGTGFRVSLPVEAVRQALKAKGPAIPKTAPPTEAKPGEDPIDYAAERKAAEMLLTTFKTKKGKVTLASSDGSRQYPLTVGIPIPEEKFTIQTLEWEGAGLTDEDLAVLKGCRRLVGLRLGGNPQLTASGLQKLGHQPVLATLRLETNRCARESMALLANYPRLVELNLGHADCPASAIETLPRCPSLETLRTPALINDAALKVIARQCPALKELWIDSATPSSLSPLGELKSLRDLHCYGGVLDDSAIEVLGGIPAFESLMVDSPSPALIPRLKKLSGKLKRLTLREQESLGPSPWKNAAEWLPMTHLAGLENLRIDEKIAADAASLKTAAKMPQLKWLAITDTIPADQRAVWRQYASADVEAFRKARPDVRLTIDGKEYPPTTTVDGIDYAAERKAAEALIAFRKTHPLGAKINLRLARTGDLFEHPSEVSQLPAEPFTVSQIIDYPGHVTDDVLALLRDCRQIEILDFAYGKTAITDEGLRHLQGLHSLGELRLAYCRQIKGEAAALISANPNLQLIDLHYGPDVSPPALETALRGCRRLRKLYLEGRQAIPPLFPALAEHCRELQVLEIGEPHGVDLPALASLPHLRQIAISGEHLKPDRVAASIAALKGMRSLETLHFDPPTSDEGLKSLAPLAKTLKALHVGCRFDWDPGVSAEGWSALEDFTALEKLHIGGVKTSFNGPGVIRLAKLPNLKEFSFRCPKDRQAYTAADVGEVRRLRPDIDLTASLGDETKYFPALQHYPKGLDGRSMAAWDLPKDAPAPAIVPFTPDEAKTHQEAWSKFTKQPVEVENSLGMKLRLIPPGERSIPLPSNGQQAGQGPQIIYRLTQPYHLGTTEVTVAQFRKFLEETGYQPTGTQPGGDTVHALLGDWKPNGFWKELPYALRDDDPAILVSHADAWAFCEWLSKKEGAVYRLPTECEWFFACGAGGDKRYGFVDTIEELREHGWDLSSRSLPISKESSPLHQVGTRKPNPFGLFDMFGNVHELTRDRLPVDRLEDLSLVNPTGQVGPSASYCGGSWYGAFDTASPWPSRGWDDVPVSRGHAHIGFRVLKKLPGAKPLPKPFEGPVTVNPSRPLSSQAMVNRPEPIAGLRSWTIEPVSHNGGVIAAMAWSPRGDVIATAYANDTCIRVWDREGNLKQVLVGHDHDLTSLSFSQDGAFLASGERRLTGSGGRVCVWDLAAGQCRMMICVPGWVQAVAFSPAGRELAFGNKDGGGPNLLTLLNLDSGHWRHLVGPDNGASGLSRISWSPDGRSLAIRDNWGFISIRRRDAADPQKMLEVPDWKDGQKGCDSVAWSPDGKWIAAGNGKLIRLWDAGTGTLQKSIETEFVRSNDITWSRDSRRLLVSGEGGSAWSIYDAVERTQLAQADKSVDSHIAAWNPDQTEVVAWPHHAGGPLVFCDAATGKVVRRGPHRGKANGWLPLPIGESGKITAVPGGLRMRSFDAETGALTRELETSPIYHVVGISPSGQKAGNWFPETPLRANILDLQSGKELHPIRLEGLAAEGSRIDEFAWSPDERFVALTGSDGKIRLWNVAEGMPHATLAGHEGAIYNVAWSPDGTRLASLGNDKTVRLWNPATGALIATYREFPEAPYTSWGRRLCWTPDSRELWIALRDHAARLDVATGRFSVFVNLSQGNVVSALAISPDGDRLIGREDYGWTVLFDLSNYRRQVLGHQLGNGAQWLPDSRRIFGFEGTTKRGIAYDTRTNQRLGTLIPAIGGDGGFNDWLCVGPTGHYRGSAKIDDHIVYVAMHDDGSQVTYTPAEFREKFGWKNDPEKATLLKLPE